MTYMLPDNQAGAPVVSRRESRTGHRLLGAAVAAAALGLWAVLAWAAPQQAGHGTHRQLGMQSCGLLARTGYPCPGCGMTTSLAAMAHGRVRRAFQAQPFGVVAFLALATFAVVGCLEACTGRALVSRLRPRPLWVWLVLAGLLVGWAMKLSAGLADGTYPLGR